MNYGRAYNFSAGPAVLPVSVLEEARDEMLVYKQAGASVLEISHRSPEYTALAASARDLLRKLLGLTDEWHILFLGGGASLQFHQVPLNFLPASGSADYLVTGAWAKKALKEAKLLGNARAAGSSEDKNFSYIPAPEAVSLDNEASYLHFTSNNTIFGTQFAKEPDAAVPLVCDASSDFLSRPLEMERYGLIYAGAQKNIGPAGVTLVMVKDSFLQTKNQGLPTLLDYGTHTAKLFHTPPVYAVYMLEKVLQWLDDLGGLPAIEQTNETKARDLYARIDKTDFYHGTAAQDSRSKMNVTFRIQDEALEPVFIAEAKAAGLHALKGHRSVGGIRASIYNACPTEAVSALVQFMDDFESRKG